MTDHRRAARVATLVQRLDAFEKQLIEEALRDNFGDREATAKSLGLSMATLALKTERLDIDDGARQHAPGPRRE